MYWSWFDLNWPWIGSVAAVTLLVLLFATSKFRSDLSRSRWYDPVWLAWLAAPVYMIHNIEEYGIDLMGQRHAFPDALCTTLGLSFYPSCPIPPAFYLAVNISLIWVVAPVAAMLSRRHPLGGLTFYGLIFTNGMTHLAPMILGRGYNPGLLTAGLLFLPVSIWCAGACFGPGRIPRKGIPFLIAAGVIGHIILMGSVLLFIRGAFDDTVLVLLQFVNAAVFLAIPFLGERLVKPSSSRSIEALADYDG
jgi:hypothetical protein